MKYMEYVGNLSTYYETGMEYLSLGINIDNPVYRQKNPKYDKNDSSFGPEFFLSLDGFVQIEKRDKIEIILPNGETKVFNMGNFKLAKLDLFKIGGAYPFEITEIENLEKYISYFNQGLKAKIVRPILKVGFYGGTFDPIHNGHKEIIHSSSSLFDELVVLPTSNYTKNNILFPIEQRIKAVDSVTKNFRNVKTLDWGLNEDTSKTYEMFLRLKEIYGVEPVIIVGSDNLESIKLWKNYDKLKDCMFYIFPRKGNAYTKSDIPLNKYQFVNFPQGEEISSTDIKKNSMMIHIPQEAQDKYDLSLMKRSL